MISKIFRMASVTIGVLIIIYVIGWILSGDATRKHSEVYKKSIRAQQEKIK